MTTEVEPRFDLPKETWGEGPWMREPDRLDFEHAGFPCLLVRGPLGQWCGYVAMPPGHRLHGRDSSECDEAVSVHGGITYADSCAGHVCHVPKPGEPDNVWWLGFDFAHAYDFKPAMQAMRKLSGGGPPPQSLLDAEHYWTMDEARAETERLADQVAGNDT